MRGARHAGRVGTGGHLQPQRHEVVGVVQIVELGGVDDLRLAIERGVREEVQVVEISRTR